MGVGWELAGIANVNPNPMVTMDPAMRPKTCHRDFIVFSGIASAVAKHCALKAGRTPEIFRYAAFMEE